MTRETRTQLEQLNIMLHKIRGLQQVLNNFTQCLENEVEIWSSNGKINFSELRQDCTIVTKSLCETKKVIKEVEGMCLLEN